MRDVPHHLIDICDAGDFFSMADFQRMAYEAIDGIVARGKLPFLVGGTGLYVASVADGYVLSNKMPDLAYREELERLSTERLYEMLQEAVPATDVEPKNRNRVMRMLEKLHDGDDVTPGKEPRYHTLRLGVTWDREVLRARIDERLERRLAEGMIEEVRGLLNAGVSVDFLKKLGLEYRMITQYLLREIETREEMTTLLANAIKQFAKRQMTWFRRDQSIRWLDTVSYTHLDVYKRQQKLNRLLKPLLRLLMPSVKREETKQAVTMNLSANLLGLGNAATPMGMSAMRLMEQERMETPAVQHAMYMLLILNATSIQLIPTTVLTLRIAAGSAAPNAILLPSLLCTAASTAVGVSLGLICRGWMEKRHA